MRRILTILLVPMLFAGCCTTGGKFCKGSIPSAACEGTVTGYTFTGIGYGDSKLVVVPISRLHAGTEWRFRLQPIRLDSDPEGVNYRNVNVTIEGKPAGDPPTMDHNGWISASGSYKSTAAAAHTFAVCVPADVPIGTIYEYLVEVDLVGTIDPRGDVEE